MGAIKAPPFLAPDRARGRDERALEQETPIPGLPSLSPKPKLKEEKQFWKAILELAEIRFPVVRAKLEALRKEEEGRRFPRSYSPEEDWISTTKTKLPMTSDT